MPSRKQTVWFAAKLTLVLLAVELMLHVAGAIVGLEPGPTDVRAQRFVYRHEPWVRVYYRELVKCDWGFAQYIMWRREPFEGEYITVDRGGFRRTWNKPNVSGQPCDTILVFGGSTAWGAGARDEYTIPSHVAKMLTDAGNYTLINCGESAYTFDQEVMYLVRLLRSGIRPRYAVFYDGVNDVYSAWDDGDAETVANYVHLKTTYEDVRPIAATAECLYRILRSGSFVFTVFQRAEAAVSLALAPSSAGEEISAAEVDALVTDIVRSYWRSCRLLDALADSYGFEYALFWQPVIYTEASLTEEERRYSDAHDAQLAPAYRRMLDLPPTALPGVHDLSGVLADHDSTVYIDHCHLSEAANRVVAKAIIEHMGLRTSAE